ncbi:MULTISPECIES: hypothetical protein [Asticcacaulis]|uniref:hypothetical protein n=1 Tax=Asticcacaulis TaxID=76890 RepID=UPI001AE7D2E6|nr:MULTISPECIES: hypothetical protein [Asticcacaulis]MBP2157800.1 hypothetical protein [Asticcacaulis solisilvae]MDR6798845.1 hypothetical protein [Asticcacaulis sp. BE141]
MSAVLAGYRPNEIRRQLFVGHDGGEGQRPVELILRHHTAFRLIDKAGILSRRNNAIAIAAVYAHLPSKQGD